VYRMDYRALFLAHEQRGAAVTLAVTKVPADQTRRFGMVTTDRGGRVRTLEEKPEKSVATHANMGIYVFETEVLREMLRSRPVDPRQVRAHRRGRDRGRWRRSRPVRPPVARGPRARGQGRVDPAGRADPAARGDRRRRPLRGFRRRQDSPRLGRGQPALVRGA